ncbi:MAG TPA: pyridoxamine 5'-phosphate oxidase family protein [Solirubrobacteraceae bacterium]|nr:pyridoxamine 5'-phosphate oxidase family protein [Solirubrobacteraceae bacterium]
MAIAPSQRTRVRRAPARAVYERETIDAVLDEGLIAHLGFTVDGQPYVIPTLHARIGDTVYIHGSSASRMIRTLTARVPACLTVTLIDGMVLARSAFHHSMNYRSVVVLGEARAVSDPTELMTVMKAFTEKLVPGRWDEVREPNRKELKGTRALAMTLDEASAKVRSGPPVDDDEDYDLDVWAGVIPLGLAAQPPQPDPQLREGIAPSDVVTGWTAGGR